MTKRNIIRRIADELGCSELETRPIVQKTSDAIINVLAVEGRVELRNFGVFEVKKRKPRQARNQRTGEKIMVGESVTVKFKPGRLAVKPGEAPFAARIVCGPSVLSGFRVGHPGPVRGITP